MSLSLHGFGCLFVFFALFWYPVKLVRNMNPFMAGHPKDAVYQLNQWSNPISFTPAKTAGGTRSLKDWAQNSSATFSRWLEQHTCMALPWHSVYFGRCQVSTSTARGRMLSIRLSDRMFLFSLRGRHETAVRYRRRTFTWQGEAGRHGSPLVSENWESTQVFAKKMVNPWWGFSLWCQLAKWQALPCHDPDRQNTLVGGWYWQKKRTEQTCSHT